MLYRIFIPILFTVALLGCGTPTPLPPPPPITPTRAVVAQPTVPTVPSSTQPSPTSPPAQPSPTFAGTTHVKIFLIAIDDGGKSGKKIGCNDSVVGVERTIPPTQAPLTAALTELFSIHDRNYGQSGLYNILYKSTLKVDGATIVNAKATINLSGKTMLGGVCDNPRFKAQIEETALQFSTVNQVAVFINNLPIDQLLSGK